MGTAADRVSPCGAIEEAVAEVAEELVLAVVFDRNMSRSFFSFESCAPGS